MPIETDKITGRKTTGHEWDGIRELDSPIPKTVFWAYGIALAVAVAGWVLYPSFPYFTDYLRGTTGETSRAVVLEQLEDARVSRAAGTRELLSRSLDALGDDAGVRARHEASAAVLFADNCAVCHGADLTGQTGFPNLVDDAWLFPGELAEIETTIRYGINDAHDESRSSIMQAYGRDELLDRAAIRDVTEFVLSLSGRAEDNAAASRGREIFAAECVACHGDGGEGIGIGAPDLTDDYWIYGGERADIRRIVHNGKTGHMPAWDGRLSDAEIRKLALYVHWSRQDGEN